MEITVTTLNRLNLIVVEGSINSNSASQFSAALQEGFDAGVPNLVIDMQRVDYLNSAGVRGLVSALKRAAQSGGRLKLAHPSARVREVLQITGMLSLFEIYDDQVLAVGSF